jgi:hypothetical protein
MDEIPALRTKGYDQLQPVNEKVISSSAVVRIDVEEKITFQIIIPPGNLITSEFNSRFFY